MEQFFKSFWKSALAAGGLAGIGAFVFWALYNKWISLPGIFSQLSKEQTFIIMLVFLILTFLFTISLVTTQVMMKTQKRETGNVLHHYEALKKGLSSPQENIAQIERIANSSDPMKETFLREIADQSFISFLEVDAINQALVDLSDNKLVKNLKDRVREKEIAKINKMVVGIDYPVLRTVIMTCKYWRYTNRKNHPQYGKVNEFISIVMAKGFNEEALRLSKELQHLFQQESDTLLNSYQGLVEI